jgi:hypothetical protein
LLQHQSIGIFIYHRPTRCTIALPKHHIIIPSVLS